MKINFKSYKFTPILGWSSSRYDLFTRCKRQYFYNYYSKFVPNVTFDKMKQLKALTSEPLEVGNVVHHIVETLLKRLQKSSEPIDSARFLQYGEQLCDKFFAEKEFIELYYKQKSVIDIDGAKQKINQSLRNLLDSDLLKWVMSTAVQTSDEWVIEPAGYGETRIDDLKAYCKMDFLFPVNDKLFILDWKSGKKHPEKHSKQLMGYALAAQENNPELDPNTIVPRTVYLYPEMDTLEFSITPETLMQFRSTVKEQSEEMYLYCKDVEKNIPKDITTFERTSYTQSCAYCPFQEICTDSEPLPF